MAEKVYVGKGKVVGKFNQLKLGIRVDDLVKNANEKGYVNILVGEMREADKYGNTHTAWIDDWKPDTKKESTGVSDESLPF
jgi:hypothetical protein